MRAWRLTWKPSMSVSNCEKTNEVSVMNRTADISSEQVTPEEVERRVQEYRRLGYLRRLPAQVVYAESHWRCPWPNCDYRIAGIHFQLEKMGGDSQPDLLAAWWQGPGLVGKCPYCNQFVLYGLREKSMVSDPTLIPQSLMPENWHQIAHLVIRPSKEKLVELDCQPQ